MQTFYKASWAHLRAKAHNSMRCHPRESCIWRRRLFLIETRAIWSAIRVCVAAQLWLCQYTPGINQLCSRAGEWNSVRPAFYSAAQFVSVCECEYTWCDVIPWWGQTIKCIYEFGFAASGVNALSAFPVSLIAWHTLRVSACVFALSLICFFHCALITKHIHSMATHGSCVFVLNLRRSLTRPPVRPSWDTTFVHTFRCVLSFWLHTLVLWRSLFVDCILYLG